MSFSAFDDAKIRTFLSILYVLIRYDTLSAGSARENTLNKWHLFEIGAT